MKVDKLKALLIKGKLYKIESEDRTAYFVSPTGSRVLKKNIVGVTPERYGKCKKSVRIVPSIDLDIRVFGDYEIKLFNRHMPVNRRECIG